MREVILEKTRTKQALAEAKADRIRKLNDEVIPKSKNAAKGSKWDVTGTWAITCPEVEQGYGRDGGSCSLEISPHVIAGRKQMYASFDFIAITGIFRFVAPTPTGASQRRQASKGSDDEDENENDEVDEEDEFREDTPTPEEFYLAPDDHPSPKNPTWNYRWRGEETGEGEIQLFSDEKLYSITFAGVGGSKLNGMLDGGILGRIEFTGLN